jgi:hypothetical protein
VNLFDVLEDLTGSEHCLVVVADVRERFNLKILADREVKEQYLVTIISSFAVLENLDDEVDINAVNY